MLTNLQKREKLMSKQIKRIPYMGSKNKHSIKLLNTIIEHLTVLNTSYEKIQTATTGNPVVYLDPPYMDTATYENTINNEEFKKYVESLTNQNIPVFVSEYTNPHHPILTEILQIQTTTSFSSGSSNAPRTEKLFWNWKK